MHNVRARMHTRSTVRNIILASRLVCIRARTPRMLCILCILYSGTNVVCILYVAY